MRSSLTCTALLSTLMWCLSTQPIHGFTLLPPLQSSSASASRSSKLAAKPKKIVPVFTGEPGQVPANMRRKVAAKRPARGHVVPQAVKRKGTGGSSNPKLQPQGRAREAGLNNPSMLTILGGTAKGRRLDSPEVYLRPMMGKVKEAVYSTFRSIGLYDFSVRHLDIFAGSGSVGLESLSRGASHCTFVDFSQDCCNAVQRNVDWCEFDERNDQSTQVVCADAIQALTDPASVGIDLPQTYSLVTLCPPYEEIIYADLLDAVTNAPLVGEDTIVMVEYPIELGTLPHVLGTSTNKLIGLRNRKYGRTVIAIYIVNPTGKLSGAISRPEEFVSL